MACIVPLSCGGAEGQATQQGNGAPASNPARRARFATPAARHAPHPPPPTPKPPTPPHLRRSAAAIRELVSTPQFRHQLDLFRWGALALLPSAAAGWLGLAMVGSADSGAAGMALGAA
jgi:hypothetical protein